MVEGKSIGAVGALVALVLFTVEHPLALPIEEMLPELALSALVCEEITLGATGVVLLAD